MDRVDLRGTCSPDIANLANCLLVEVLALLALPRWYAGFGAPDDSIGKDTDFYIDRDTGDVYEKENGSWLS